MLFLKEGFPEESEIVICTVTSVRYNSVFAKLNEYNNKSGMIHISEVSPGRIRNIRDYVKEGKVIVCKVLKINEERGYIDLSLRRVNEGQRRSKLDEMKKEQKAEKIVEFVAKSLKKDFKKFYSELTDKIFKKYDLLASCFEDVVEKKITLDELGIDKKTATELNKIIEERIKPAEVDIKGNLNLVSEAPDGVELVKQAIKKGIREDVKILYMGAGNYRINVKASDYKEAEKILKQSTSPIIEFAEKNHMHVEFKRIEK
jgi:translation initiation factor 2 subunit 1